MVELKDWWRLTWRFWRRWRLSIYWNPSPPTLLLVVVVVAMVGWNVLPCLTPAAPLHPPHLLYGDVMTTTTKAVYVRPLVMDWRRRWIRPWPTRKRTEEDERNKRRKIGRGGRGRKQEEEAKEEEVECNKKQEGREAKEEQENNDKHSDTCGCDRYRVGFAAGDSLPPIALASYPGSGNTWLRQLLEGATGVFTGSTYDDQHLYITGLNGELEPWSAGTTLTQKTHSASPSVIAAFRGRAVLLVRNPYHALLSYHNYLFGGHFGFAPVGNYRSKDWGAFVHMQARAWIEMATNWTKLVDAKVVKRKRKRKGQQEEEEDAGGRVAVVHYEELLQDPVTPLLPALASLPLPLPSPDRLACLRNHQRSRHFKRKQEHLPKGLEVFSPTDRDKLDRAIRYVDHHLRRLQLPPLPLHLYEYYNNTPPLTKKTIRVPCLEGETVVVCDARVDQLNAAWRRRRRKRKEGNEGSSSTSAGHGEEQDEEEQEQEEWIKEPLVKMGRFLTQGFTGLMKHLRGNPLLQEAGRTT